MTTNSSQGCFTFLIFTLPYEFHRNIFTDSDPRGIDVDPIKGLLYLADEDKKEIQSIEFESRTTQTIINLSPNRPYDIAVDGNSG